MPERDVKIATPDGEMNTMIAYPDGAGPFPSAVIFQHVGGLSESMRPMARRIAQAGYVCALPALYYRLGSIVVDPLDPDERVAAIRTIASNSLTPATVMSDTRAVLRYLDRDPAVRPGVKGLVGYGWTGGLTLLAAATFPDVFRATAVVLGVRFVIDAADSPHLSFDRIRGEVYCGFCERDPIIPPSVPERLIALFKQHAIDAQVVFHPNVEHGYPFPNRKIYDRPTAEKEWAQIFAMFERQIGRPDAGRAP